MPRDISRSHPRARSRTNSYGLFFILILLYFVSFSAMAGDPLTDTLKGFVDWVKSGLGMAFASAVLIAIGVAWAFNKIHFGWVVGYCVGIGFIFGGQAIVTTIRSWIA